MYVVLEGMLSICFMLCHPLRERSILRKKNNRYWGNPYFPLDGNEKERFADGTTTFLASTFRRCMYDIGGMLLIFGQWHHPLTNPKWWKTFYARRTIPISSKTVLSDGQKWHVFHRCMAAAGIPEQYRRMQLGFTVRNIFFVFWIVELDDSFWYWYVETPRIYFWVISGHTMVLLHVLRG